MKKIIFVLALISLILTQSCIVPDELKTDCGYYGIKQPQCETKGCCWVPSSGTGNIPWCFYPSGSNPCQNINFDWAGGPGFDDAFYALMYQLFDANINIQSKGGVVASPDKNTPGGSYYYHWMRDAGLTMRVYQQLNDLQLSKIQEKMKSYVSFVLRVQSQLDPNGNDIRINPKFELPNGQVYVGGWCRPQTDGPALTAGALIMFANNLLDAGQQSYVYQNLWTKDGSKNGGAIKYDLDWVISNWQSNGCDLWQQIRDSNFFWNRMAFAYSLKLASAFATRVGDSGMASKYDSTRSAIQATLDGHWTGTFMQQTPNRQKDGAVIHSFATFPGYYQWTDAKVASTIKVFSLAFCAQYSINQNDNKAGLPGILIGRYPGDSYAGGNPWQLLTAVLAQLFYKGASAIEKDNSVLTLQNRRAWAQVFKISQNASQAQFAQAAAKAGDAVMYRLYEHVKSDGGHIAEQISKTAGTQTSAKDLTWSFANLMSALHYRKSQLSGIFKRMSVKSE